MGDNAQSNTLPRERAPGQSERTHTRTLGDQNNRTGVISFLLTPKFGELRNETQQEVLIPMKPHYE